MTAYYTVIFSFFICLTSSLKQFSPPEVKNILKTSCLFALLSDNDDVYLSQSTENLFRTLSEDSFKSEKSVQIGYINLKSFSWSNNQTLRTIKDEYISFNDMILFPKMKVDRTCLLSPNQTPPKVHLYKGALSSNLVVNFINNYCNTYRTLRGAISYEGLHKEEIVNNLFTVASMPYYISSKNVFITDQESCSPKIKDDDMIYEKSMKYKSNHDDYVMPKCEKISLPSKSDFFHNYLKISKPVIIEGAAKMWPAMSKWSNKFLRKEYGSSDVHIKLTPGGEFEGVESSELWNNFKTFKIPYKVRDQLEFPDLVVVRPATFNMKFSELVDLIQNVSDGVVKNISAYLEYSSIPNRLPKLEIDIEELPFIKDMLSLEHLNIWFSDGNTLGKLHFDPFDNFLCQISGRKQVILFEPHDNTRLYEGHIPEAMLAFDNHTKTFSRKELVQSTSMVMSPVDIAKVDLKRFPRFADTYPLNCTIDEGDVLFMPSFWWHEVQSFPNRTAKRNLAVNFWYDPFLTREFPCPTCKLDVNPKYRHLL